MKKRITGSVVGRAIKCPGSQVLPWVTESGTAAQDKGNAIHAYLELLASPGWTPESALGRIAETLPDQVKACEALDLDKLAGWYSVGAPEVSFAYSTKRGGRILGQARDRNYDDVAQDEIALTIDGFEVAEDRESARVWDYKTGNTDLGSVKDNAQLLMSALAIASTFKVEKVTVEIVYIRGSEVWCDRTELDIFDLARFKVLIEKLERKLEQAHIATQNGGTPDVNGGDWCKFCPAFNVCPKQKSLAMELATGNDSVGISMNRGQMATALTKIKEWQLLLNQLKKAIYAEAEREPLPLDNGKVLGPRTKQGNEKLDGSITYEVIKETYGEETAMKAVKFTATKTDISAALKDHGVSKLAPAKKEVLEEIRNRGGSERKTNVRIEEYVQDV